MFPFVLENIDADKSSKFLVDEEEEADEEDDNETQKEEKEEKDEDDCIPKVIPHIVAMDSLGMHSQKKIGKWIK